MHFPVLPHFIPYLLLLLLALALALAWRLYLDRKRIRIRLEQEQNKSQQLQRLLDQLPAHAEPLPQPEQLPAPKAEKNADSSESPQKSLLPNPTRYIDIKPNDIEITSIDEQLIKKAVGVVEQNMSNAEFSVQDLSHSLAMSRVYLYKKILALTGKTPIEFIRVIRLKRAAQLLESSQLTVAEVAYKVGFNNPKYFAHYFKAEFDLLPKAYQKKLKHPN
jgi:AraC-like DNA-binding protein